MLTQVARSIYCLIFLNVIAFEILKENERNGAHIVHCIWNLERECTKLCTQCTY